MNQELKTAFADLFCGRDLSESTMQAAIGALMDGACDPIDIAALLTALKMKGEMHSELIGAARAMRERATPIVCQRKGLLDTCGTGGDNLHTFNISTATAMVVAACGVGVAKHGNRSVSSSSGSADVLEALGVNTKLAPERVAASIDEVGMGFCFAPLIHGAMKYAVPVRRQLEFRTIFNLLGPLTNPAGAEFQLLGVNENGSARKVAQALAALPISRAIVVCGNGELDEVSLWGSTLALTVENSSVTESTWTPDDFGLPECDVAALRVDSAQASADTIRGIFENRPGPARDIVVANSAAALFACRRASDLKSGVELADTAISSGTAAEFLETLVAFGQKG